MPSLLGIVYDRHSQLLRNACAIGQVRGEQYYAVNLLVAQQGQSVFF